MLTKLLLVVVALWTTFQCQAEPPLCERLEMFSRIVKTTLDLKCLSQVASQLYLIDEFDYLFVINLAEKRLIEFFKTNKELLMFKRNNTTLAERQDEDEEKYWTKPIAKWYNIPWLRVDSVESPLKKLMLFVDGNGVLWKQYLFVDGTHRLVNNRTGREAGTGKRQDFWDYSVISNSTGGGFILYYNNYTWLRDNAETRLADRRVIAQPLSTWQTVRQHPLKSANKDKWIYLETEHQRDMAMLSRAKPQNVDHYSDLVLNLPLGFIYQDTVVLCTLPFTREVILFNMAGQGSDLVPQEADKPTMVEMYTKSWASFFRCSNTKHLSFGSPDGLGQKEYIRVAESKFDNRIQPGSYLSVAAAYVVGIFVVLGGCFAINICGHKNIIKPKKKRGSSTDRKTKLRRESDLILKKKKTKADLAARKLSSGEPSSTSLSSDSQSVKSLPVNMNLEGGAGSLIKLAKERLQSESFSLEKSTESSSPSPSPVMMNSNK